MAIVICPECNKKISTTTTKCIHCGAKIKFCPDCDSAVLEEDKKCPECGYKFVVAENKENTADQKNDTEKQENGVSDTDNAEVQKTNAQGVLMVKELFETWKDKEKYTFLDKGPVSTAFTVASVIKWLFLIIGVIGVFADKIFSFYFIPHGLLVIMLSISVLLQVATFIRVGITIYLQISAEKNFISHVNQTTTIEKAFEHDKTYIEKYVSGFENDGFSLKAVAFAIMTEFYGNNTSFQVLRIAASIVEKLLSALINWVTCILSIIVLTVGFFNYSAFVPFIIIVVNFVIIEGAKTVVEKISKSILGSTRKKWLEQNSPATFIFEEKLVSIDTLGIFLNDLID